MHQGRPAHGRAADRLAPPHPRSGESSFGIVSGLARRIDAAAHAAASRGAPSRCWQADRVYPHENAGLLDGILASSVAMSEMPLGWEPHGRDFPRRNRLISGLALGVVIVEAAKRSGSLITT